MSASLAAFVGLRRVLGRGLQAAAAASNPHLPRTAHLVRRRGCAHAAVARPRPPGPLWAQRGAARPRPVHLAARRGYRRAPLRQPARPTRPVLPNLQERYRVIEEYLRVRGYNTLRILAAGVAVTGVGLYFSRHYFKQELSVQVAEVTSRSLEQETVVNRANELAKGIVEFILTDPAVSEQAVYFLQKLFEKEATQTAVVNLLAHVIAQPSAQRSVTELGVILVRNLAHDEYTMNQLVHLIGEVIVQPHTQRMLVRALQDLVADEKSKEAIGALIGDVIVSPLVIDKATEAGLLITHNILGDEEVQSHASSFAATALASDELHEQGAVAVWQTLKYSMLPRFLYHSDRQRAAAAESDADADTLPPDYIDLKAATKNGGLSAPGGPGDGAGSGGEGAEPSGTGEGEGEGKKEPEAPPAAPPKPPASPPAPAPQPAEPESADSRKAGVAEAAPAAATQQPATRGKGEARLYTIKTSPRTAVRTEPAA